MTKGPEFTELSIEQFALLAQLLARVDTSIKSQYPQLGALPSSSIKVLAHEDFHAAVTSHAKSLLHPEFLSIVQDAFRRKTGGEIMFVTPETDHWFDWSTGNSFIDRRSIDKLSTDSDQPVVEGLALIRNSINYAVKSHTDSSKRAEQIAHDMVDTSFDGQFTLSKEDKKKMHVKIKKGKPEIWMRGAVYAIRIEGAFFGAPVKTQLHELLIDYLARPSMIHFTKAMIDEQNVDPSKEKGYMRMATLASNIYLTAPQRIQAEEYIANILKDLGLTTRQEAFTAFSESLLLKEFVSTYKSRR